VRVTIPHYGDPSTAPIYASFYSSLEAAGYTPGRDLVVAGYDFRLTPDLGGFLPRTKRLIVRTWRRNGRRPVRLVGHSNGPLYVQYLLTHVSDRFKHRYIQGFTDIAGNLPGQGGLWTYVFAGVDIPDAFAFPDTPATARSSARLIARSPSTWMSASDPAVFGRREVVVRANGHAYTPADTPKLLRAARLRSLAPMIEHYLGFVRFRGRAHQPGVDVTAEKGSGLPTQVGVVLPDLRRGQVLDPATARFIDLPGDGNQEFITNDAVRVWRHMRCHRFRLFDRPGVSHLDLPSDPKVMARLLRDLRTPRTRCG
jgi:lecithin-cholesterol acyltransferase